MESQQYELLNSFINNSSINFSDTLNSTKTKFDFSMTKKKFTPFNLTNLKPVLTKKIESKEIKLLRQSFSNFKNFKSNDKDSFHINKLSKKSGPNMGNIFWNSFKPKNNDKMVIKKHEKFFEELKNKRLIGNK